MIPRERVMAILGGMRGSGASSRSATRCSTCTLLGDVDRISPEALVPVVTVHERRHAVGRSQRGGERRRATRRARVRWWRRIGDDRRGQQLRRRDRVARVAPTRGSALAARSADHVEDAGRGPAGGSWCGSTRRRDRALGGEAEAALHRERPRGSSRSATACRSRTTTSGVPHAGGDRGGGTAAAKQRGIPTRGGPEVPQLLAYGGATLFKPNRRELEHALGAAVDLEHP